ncbi:MAG: hypothetical protein Q8L53_18160 [Aestuariivirga sp.]|nr:hypothetical protein [Aestuariivirga sp.]
MKIFTRKDFRKLITLIAIIGALWLAFPVTVLIFTWLAEDILYDTQDADFSWLDKRLTDIGASFVAGDAKEQTLDFSQLNGGQWETVCAIGGYVDPIKTIIANGGIVSETDRENLNKKNSGLRLGIVEEFEFMIAYIQADRSTNFIHFSYGIGSGGQHFEKCIKRPTTVMSFS